MFVPETGNAEAYPRYFFAALGAQAIGWSPFGMDETGYANYPLGAAKIDDASLAPFALNYAIVGPMQGEIAALSYAGKVRGTAEAPDTHVQYLDFAPEDGKPARWRAVVSYGMPAFYSSKPAPGNPKPEGGALVAQLGPEEFLVTGVHAKVDFEPVTTATGADKPQRLWAVVEEGSYVDGKWKTTRIWNGDQTDYGLNFTSQAQVLRVRLATF
jgi:beta-galactosidase GanA